MALAGKGNEKIWPQGSFINVIICIVVQLDFLISVNTECHLQITVCVFSMHSLHLKHKIISNHAFKEPWVPYKFPLPFKVEDLRGI